jgi:hypothetical protein
MPNPEQKNWVMMQGHQSNVPEFNSKEKECIICKAPMFYSKENLVHVCLRNDHGILAFFEPDSCWFAAEEKTVLELSRKGVKNHFIPQNVFETGGIGSDFECAYQESERERSG